jgi:TetR/AcrR family transcriptional regulator, repressor for uid operon
MELAVRKVDPVKHEEKRRQILEAAGRCFAREGFHGASTSAICAEAKISPGHLYHYFPSKEAIISDLTSAGLARTTEHFKKTVAGPDVLAAFLNEFERVRATSDPSIQLLFLDMLAEAGRNPEIGRILRKHSHEIQATLADFLRKGQSQGQIDPDLDPDAAAATLLMVIDGAKTLFVREPLAQGQKTDAYLRRLITRFLAPPHKEG